MSQHNEIIERARDRVLASAFIRMAQMARHHKGVGSVPEGFIILVYDEVLSAFKSGVNAKADAMMAVQSEGGSE